MKKLGSTFGEEEFLSLIDDNEFLQKTLEGKLAIPNFPSFTQELNNFYNQVNFFHFYVICCYFFFFLITLF